MKTIGFISLLFVLLLSSGGVRAESAACYQTDDDPTWQLSSQVLATIGEDACKLALKTETILLSGEIERCLSPKTWQRLSEMNYGGLFEIQCDGPLYSGCCFEKRNGSTTLEFNHISCADVGNFRGPTEGARPKLGSLNK